MVLSVRDGCIAVLHSSQKCTTRHLCAHLFAREPLRRVHHQQLADQVLGLRADLKASAQMGASKPERSGQLIQPCCLPPHFAPHTEMASAAAQLYSTHSSHANVLQGQGAALAPASPVPTLGP